MDRAIEVCRSLKAIVLVIPYPTIVLDRGNHLISLICSMEERFPELICQDSETSNLIFILVNKRASSCQNVNTIGERFSDLCLEYQNMLSHSKGGVLERESLKKRIRIISMLKSMRHKGHVDLIGIKDGFEKDEILTSAMIGASARANTAKL
jgi:hypothetical protein